MLRLSDGTLINPQFITTIQVIREDICWSYEGSGPMAGPGVILFIVNRPPLYVKFETVHEAEHLRDMFEAATTDREEGPLEIYYVDKENLLGLQASVDRFLGEGWGLYGDLKEMRGYFVQAMIREKRPC